MTGSDLGRLARTAAHVHPAQIGQRIRLRAQRAALNQWPQASRWLLAGPDPAVATGWPAKFKPLDMQVWQHWHGGAALRVGRINLLGTTRVLEHPDGHAVATWNRADWNLAGEPLLWRFHLHYWDWAWGLVGEPKQTNARALFGMLWRSWHSAVLPGRGVPWHPYPAALRAWSFCGLHHDLVAGTEIEEPFLLGLAAHAGFLRHHLERDVGGNHLIKNLKALAGLAVFFADDRLLERALVDLDRQLQVQVLADGGHYERSPAYHCQVLADVVDIANLLAADQRIPPPDLLLTIRRMRRWLGGVLTPDGQVPLLNDGFPVSGELVAAVQPAMPSLGPLLVLPDTGLVRAACGGWHLLADVGLPCPNELPAHAHADTLGCLVYVDGEPLLVDTGTSSYAPGPVRSRERSTAAHNTVEIDGSNSTEVWGEFRAGRRARVHDVVTGAHAGTVTIEATHDGFRALPGRPHHRRRWSLSEHGLEVDDTITGRGHHSVVVRWHLPPRAQVQLTPEGAVATTPAGKFMVTVTSTRQPVLAVETAQLASGFDRRTPAPVLSCGFDAALPVRVSTAWRRASDTQGVR